MLIIALYATYMSQDYSIKNFWDILLNRVGWFWYSYIAFLIMLPYIEKIALGVTRKQAVLFGLMVCFFSIMTTVEYAFDLPYSFLDWVVPLFNNANISWIWNVVFPILGYWFHRRLNIKKINKYQIIFINILNAIVVLWYSAEIKKYYYETGRIDECLFHLRSAPFIALTAFITAKYLFDRVAIPKWFSKILEWGSKNAMGVFLLTTSFGMQYRLKPLYIYLQRYFANGISLMIWIVCVFGICMLLTAMIRFTLRMIYNYIFKRLCFAMKK